MSMTPIVVTWPGEAAPGTFTFALSKATLDSILTAGALYTAFGAQSQDDGVGTQITETNFADGLANNPALNPEPDLLMAILAAALLGGGLMGTDISMPPNPWSTCVAERLYRSKPLLARSTVAQIVTACIAAG